VAIHDSDVTHLDVEVLVHGMKGSADTQVVLELNHDILPNETLEEGEE